MKYDEVFLGYQPGQMVEQGQRWSSNVFSLLNHLTWLIA
jgi:hypothetical protein